MVVVPLGKCPMSPCVKTALPGTPLVKDTINATDNVHQTESTRIQYAYIVSNILLYMGILFLSYTHVRVSGISFQRSNSCSYVNYGLNVV